MDRNFEEDFNKSDRSEQTEEADRNKEILFARALEDVKRIGKEQGNYISKEQLDEAFGDLDLSSEHMELVTDYLKKQKIGIGEPIDVDDYLTREEADYLKEYLEELTLLGEVSRGEREAIILSAMAGDATAQMRLTEIFLLEVVEIAKLYSGQGVYLEDLIGEGNLAIASGVSMLGCVEHVTEAEGFLGKMIMDAMEEYIADSLRDRQTDEKMAEQVNKVAEQAKQLAETLQKKVTPQELAQETKLSVEDILEAVRISGDNIEYIEKGRDEDAK